MGSATGLEHDLIAATDTQFDAYSTVQAGPLHGVSLPRAALSLVRLGMGVLQSLGIILRQRPRAAFFTGGWVSVPVAVAGWLLRVPIIIYVPDIEPGLTLKVLGRFARVVTATTEDTAAYFPRRRVVATGYPLRADVRTATRAAGIQRFELDTQRLTLLVFGGSRGARSINRALLAQVQAILAPGDVQIIHVTGGTDWPDVQTAYAQLAPEVRAHYHLFEYLHNMGLAMAAADLVVSRAGASVLGEFPYFELPAVLVPYPYAWRYQKVNADWLASRGAALLLPDEDLPAQLAPTVRMLIDDREQREALRLAARALRVDNGAQHIAHVIVEEMT